jgi:glycosyltransferase involved in cell wall biosynthesis
MAMGKAIVTTRDGLSGNEAVPGRDLLVADQPAEFAAQILSLQANPEKRRQLGLAARRLVETKYSWANTAQRFSEIYHEVLANRRSPQHSPDPD